MKVKTLIELLQKCGPDEEVHGHHGDVMGVGRMMYGPKGDKKTCIFMMSEEDLEEFLVDWPGSELIT